MGTLIGIKEYAEKHHIHRSVVQRKIANGLLPAHKVAGIWLIDSDEPWIDYRSRGRGRRWTDDEMQTHKDSASYENLRRNDEIDASRLYKG